MSVMDKLSSVFKKGKKAGNQPQPVKLSKKELLSTIRESDLFKDLPEENLEEMLAHMETLTVKKDDDLIKENADGDFYYLLASGTAVVTRDKDGKPEVLANILEPKGFGEEALISNAKRNATITMTSKGTVMRLSKEGFNDYIKDPLITWMSPMEAQDTVAQDGAVWLDVRENSAASKSALRGAVSIPMEEFRSREGELSRETSYVCYCDNGRISSTAAFLLRQKGFDAAVMRGGLKALERQ